MSQRVRRVCLISPAPLSIDPRLRKEADALHEAGYEVIVGYRSDERLEEDDALMRRLPYQCERLDYAKATAPVRWWWSGVLQRLALWCVRANMQAPYINAQAYCRAYGPLVRWARAQNADMYIAHTHPVLPVIARVAEQRNVPFGFDCEDLLAEEPSDGGLAPWRKALVCRLETRYLPRAKYVSATSRPMAKYLIAEYGLRRVQVWHNCFATKEWEGLAEPKDRPPRAVREMAWISRTVGPSRGLEDVGAAMAALPSHFVLHLYGTLPSAHATWFANHVQRDYGSRVQLHPMPGGGDVVRALAQHHIGLSLDHPDCINRALTVCNKVFLYMHAGLACAATRTAGHRSVLGGNGSAMYEPGDVKRLAELLARWDDPTLLLATQTHSWEAGQFHYIWDVEQQFFLDTIA